MRTTCGFGHLYDTDQYSSCPYCNRGARAIFFPGSGAQVEAAPVNAGGDKTVAPGANMGDATVAPGMGSYGATVAPGAPVANLESDAVGATVMPSYMQQQLKQENENKTVAIFQKKHGINPVVGWLVCIEGPDKGKDYRVYSKINTIGRAEGNDVVLDKEPTVSQKNHARLAYDPKHNNFQLIPGESSNISYVNESPLYVPQLMKAYDVIEFGETKLIFVPLCNDSFRWEVEDKK